MFKEVSRFNPLFSLILASIFSFSVFAKISTVQNANETMIDVTIDKLDISTVDIDGKKFLKAKFDGVGAQQAILYKEGFPEIPVVRFYVEADSEKDVNISMAKANYTKGITKLNNRLMPSQESLPKIANAVRQFRFNKAFHAQNEFWPQKKYQVEKVGSFKGKQKLLVTVYPFSYNPVTLEYKFTTNFKIEVAKSLEKSKKKSSKDLFAFIIGEQFQNSPSIARYLSFKESLGYQVEKIIVNSVDTPAVIRARLQNLLNNREADLKYALIFGDIEHVPSKTATHLTEGVTDHYYRAIDTNDYDSDINGPDIGVGRLTVKSEADLSVVVNKMIRYQKGEFADESWLNGIAFIATDDRYTVAEGSHNYAVDNYTANRGYMGVFPEARQVGGDKLYAITYEVSDSTVVQTMNLGRTIINYSGHGSKTSWAGPNISQANVRSLDHGSATPFVISNACITGQFTIDESYAETWIKHASGAIMFWGSMDSSYWDEDDIMEKAMYDGIFRDSYRHFNKITQNALSAVWQYYGGENRSKYYWETYVTFGDPSIRLRTTAHQTATINGPEVVPFGMDNADYTVVDENNNPMVGVRVTLSYEDGTFIDWGMTDENGAVQLNLESDTSGRTKLIVTIYGDNLQMQKKEIQMIFPDSPFFVFSNFSLNGRVDGTVYPMEEVNINFSVKNVSPVATTGGRVDIVVTGGSAWVELPAVGIPAIAGEAIYTHSGQGPLFVVGDNVEDGDIIEITFLWASNEGGQASFVKRYKVSKAAVSVTAVDFGDVNNPLLGGLAPGSDGDVYLTITNSGSEALTQSNLSVMSDSCIGSVSGSVSVENLLPGESMRLATPIHFYLADDCANGDMATFQLNGNYLSHSDVLLPILANGAFEIGRMSKVEFVQDGIELDIPDNNFVEFGFEVGTVDKIKDISVKVGIEHTYVGDLTLTLIHPNGTEVILVKKQGGSQDDLNVTYGLIEGIVVRELENMINLGSAGSWKLKIEDSASNDIGKLQELHVTVKGYI